MNLLLARKVFATAYLVFCLQVISPLIENIYPPLEGYVATTSFIFYGIFSFWLGILWLWPIRKIDYDTFLDLVIDLFWALIAIALPHKLNPNRTWLRLLIFISLIILIVPLSLFYFQQGAFLTPWEIVMHFNLPLFWGLAILMKVWI